MESLDTIDVAISFDTTGSMYPCLTQVRTKISNLLQMLFEQVPGIKLSLIAHGDYYDENRTYLMKHIDFTNDKDILESFIKNVERTCGGDAPEAYEYVLSEVQKFSWSANKARILIMIGDDIPHTKNKYNIVWQNEVDKLFKMGVSIFSVQCLNYGYKEAYNFYNYMASKTNGYHLLLDQFSHINEMLLSVCYKQISDEAVINFEKQYQDVGMTKNMKKMFDVLLGRIKVENYDTNSDIKNILSYDENDEDDLQPCPPSKYQVLDVPKDCSIKDFVLSNGLEFKTGRGFYEFTKPEEISEKKEIILVKKDTGDIFEGRRARKIANIPDTHSKIKPTFLSDYTIFIQSTSYNRKLMNGTKFLYQAI